MTGCQDGSLALWRAADGARELAWAGHGWGCAVRAVALLPPTRIVTGSTDRTVRVWLLGENQEAERVLHGHTDTVRCLLALPDGRILSGADDSSLRLWSPGAGTCDAVITGHAGAVWALLLLPSEGEEEAPSRWRVASGSWDTTVRLWSVGPGDAWAPLMTLGGHTQRVLSLCLLPASGAGPARLVSSSEDSTLRVWDLATGASRGVDLSRGAVAHSLAPGGASRVLCGCGDGNLRTWRVPESGPPVLERTLKGHSDGIFATCLLEDGRLVTGSSDKCLCVWAQGARERVIIPPHNLGSVWAIAGLGHQPELGVLEDAWAWAPSSPRSPSSPASM